MVAELNAFAIFAYQPLNIHDNYDYATRHNCVAHNALFFVMFIAIISVSSEFNALGQTTK